MSPSRDLIELSKRFAKDDIKKKPISSFFRCITVLGFLSWFIINTNHLDQIHIFRGLRLADVQIVCFPETQTVGYRADITDANAPVPVAELTDLHLQLATRCERKSSRRQFRQSQLLADDHLRAIRRILDRECPEYAT